MKQINRENPYDTPMGQRIRDAQWIVATAGTEGAPADEIQLAGLGFLADIICSTARSQNGPLTVAFRFLGAGLIGGTAAGVLVLAKVLSAI